MTNHKDIYNQYGERYDRLVSWEDYQGNITAAIREITPLEGKRVVEFGAGTGRVTGLLAPHVRSIRAFDASAHMLTVARAKLARSGLTNWSADVGDHRALPVPDGAADIAISGWSICYLVDWDRTGWQAAVNAALAEMRRVLRPGGVIILLETQGTGFETPHPPEHLLEYYAMLEQKGFASRWIRTDYAFPSMQEADEVVRFFFGDELADSLAKPPAAADQKPAAAQTPAPVILPECTGIWWQWAT